MPHPVAPPPIVNVSDWITRQAGARPQAVAVIEQRTGASITFGELEARVCRIAHGLTQQGIASGRRAVLAVKPSIDFVALVFGLFRAGAVPVVIDPGMGRRAMLACIEEAKPYALVGIPLAHVLSLVFRRAFAGLERRVTVGPRLFWGGKTLAGLEAMGSDPRGSNTWGEQLACVLFTSGSTGIPKGVEYHHAIFDAQTRMIRDHFEIEPGEVDVACFPLFGLFSVAMGCTIVWPDMDFTRPAKIDPERLLEAMQRHKATMSFGSPAIWKKVAPWLARRGRKFPATLKRILIAGASVPLRTMHELFQVTQGTVVHTPYGATESLPVSSISTREVFEEVRQRMEQGEGTCVGRPLAGVEVLIARRRGMGLGEDIGQRQAEQLRIEDFEPCPQGEVGEILVRSPVTTRRYFQRDDATRMSKVLCADGTLFHRMGDVGKLDAEGRLWFCGRVAHVVHTAGGPLYPDQVEGVVNQVAGVARSALVGIGPRGRQVPVIVVEAEGHGVPQGRHSMELGQAVSQALSNSEVCRGVDRMLYHPGFPVDVRHNAKIDREKLAAWAATVVKGGAWGLDDRGAPLPDSPEAGP
jgi:acyl-CoA synthetase (AMP-forming)/AMP-acid ligase II